MGGGSASGLAVLAVVLSCLHLEYVGNDAVDGDVTDQACEEELFRNAGVHEAEGWETSQDTGQPAETKQRLVEFFSLHPFLKARWPSACATIVKGEKVCRNHSK